MQWRRTQHGRLPVGVICALEWRAGGASPRMTTRRRYRIRVAAHALPLTTDSCRLACALTARTGRLLLSLILGLAGLAPARAADPAHDQAIASIFGQHVYDKDLIAPDGAAQVAKTEMLRHRVWKAVFDDYARRRAIAATDAEIRSHIESHRRMKLRLDAERARRRAALIAEIESPNTNEARRRAAQQELNTLSQTAEFDAAREQEARDPAQRAIQQASERRVAEHWVRQWKLNQALYREFGGRLVFQQGGAEPIDAYRKLLERYEANKALVFRDPAWRAAVYSYFDHQFVFVDDAAARFYFEKPWWERTPEQMKAAGF